MTKEAGSVLLVTGGNGFVMANVVRHWLMTDPVARCVVLDANPPDEAAQSFFADLSDRITTITGSVTDWACLDTLAADHAISHIVHGAAVTSMRRLLDAGEGLDGIVPALEANINGTINVLAMAAKLPGLQSFVYCSSGSVYGPAPDPVPGGPVPENVRLDPDGFYGATKYASELLVRGAADMVGLPAVSVRFSSVFGPMDRDTGARSVEMAVPAILRCAQSGRAVKIISPNGIGDYIYAPDVADAICHILRAPGQATHAVYNVAAGTVATVADLIEIVSERLPETTFEETEDFEVADIALTNEQTGARWSAYDTSRMREDFGWQPRPLRDAIFDYMDWLDLP